MNSTVFHESRQMDEAELLEPGSECVFCASEDRVPIALLQENPDVSLLYCRNCHAASASRMPNQEALTKYYEGYYGGQCEKATIDGPERMASHIVRYARKVCRLSASPDVSILDYGGGDGTISKGIANSLLRLGAAKVSLDVIDYDQSLRESSVGGICIMRSDDLSKIPNQSVDLVIASAIIEHVPDPKPVLEKLFAAMKIGGGCYARTPYVFPLMRLASALKMSVDFTYPAHVHDLGARFWKHVMNETSIEGRYEVIRFTPSLVETSFNQHFMRTLAAYLLKVPGYLFKESYGLVGGWEVFIRRVA